MVNAQQVNRAIFWWPLSIVATSVLLFCVFLFTIIQIIPSYLYKWSVILVSKFVMPGSTMLTMVSRALANGDIYESNHYNICYKMLFKGNLPMNDLYKGWNERILSKKKKNSEDLLFPQLQQYIYKWMGYLFFRNDPDFNMLNHVSLFNEVAGGIYADPNFYIDTQFLNKMSLELTRKKFKRNQSPWEIVIVHNIKKSENDEEVYSAVLVKFHHALCDGYSILSLLFNHMAQIPTPTFPRVKSPPLKETLFVLPINVSKFIWGTAFDFISNQDRFFDRNDWHLPPAKISRNYCACFLQPIDKSIFREIKASTSVSVSSVLITAITGGVARMMKAKRLQVPKEIRINLPLPLPDRPEGLVNHVSMTAFHVPMQEVPNTFNNRLQKIEKRLMKSVRGPIPFLLKYVIPVFQGFPISIGKKSDYLMDTMEMSSVAVPPFGDFNICGCKPADIGYVFLPTHTNLGVVACVLGGENYFYITVLIEKNLLESENEVNDIEKYILEELQYLRCSTVV